MEPICVVVAEDDRAIRELVVHHLRRDGFRCTEAGDGPAALRAARADAGAMIVDVGLPVVDGFDVVRTLRREGRGIPVLFLTARSEEIDRIVGLELGADDYVTKPFSPRELVARVRAIVRRASALPERGPLFVRYDRLEIDEAAREARVDGSAVALKPREFALLLELASKPGVAIARHALVARVWGSEYEGDERTVDVHVRRLRARLEEAYGLPPFVRTVHGFGYKFVAEG